LNTISKVFEKLHDAEYRKAFVASQINIGLPFQVRALLKSRGKTQEWLAKKTGMLQPRISGLMTPGRVRPNIETLRRLAEAFDCGLAVRFVPFSELATWSEEFDPESFYVPEFENDAGFVDRKAPQMAQTTSARAKLPGTIPDNGILATLAATGTEGSAIPATNGGNSIAMLGNLYIPKVAVSTASGRGAAWTK